MKTSSAKAKGRRLQQKVATLLVESFEELQPDDIRSTGMGQSGEDIQLSPLARTKIPYSFECKNQERLNIWAAIEQAEANASEYAPAIVFTRNRTKTYVAIPLEEFVDLIKK
jgi:hypothetical protein|tara:strand:- start:3208 stop:3543 length:336 start_codon:yes stop_codon:yes gene_type:complete